jgi:hypothetical protein
MLSASLASAQHTGNESNPASVTGPTAPTATPPPNPTGMPPAPRSQEQIPPSLGYEPPPPPAPVPQATTHAAPRFGREFRVVLSAERLFGYHHYWYQATPTVYGGAPVSGLNLNVEGDQFALLTGGTFTGAGGVAVNPYAVPRLGVDLVFGLGMTVGGAVTYYWSGGDTTAQAGSAQANQNNDQVSVFGISARLGYVAPLSDLVGFWLRVGFTYGTQSITAWDYSSSSSTPPVPTVNEWNLHHVSFDPEFLLLVTPVQHFGLLVGLAAALGLDDSFTGTSGGTTAQDGQGSLSDIGLTAGMMGYL